MIPCNEVIKDKNGLPIKDFSLIKIYHFYGRTLRGGTGHNYMYKLVQKKEFRGELYWAALHLSVDLEDFYFLNPNKDLVMENAEVVQEVFESSRRGV